ncbi:hypothetical protein ACIHDR_11375 [Nocardia sp. NPDC052278]|uniref:hypothetical protein n=1 Tax=unclassified Nocardia TaxID=2637762 RepID=UPI0036C56DC7
MSGRLAGKIALITGTAGGQGCAAALLFAAEGAIVAGTDITPKALPTQRKWCERQVASWTAPIRSTWPTKRVSAPG